MLRQIPDRNVRCSCPKRKFAPCLEHAKRRPSEPKLSCSAIDGSEGGIVQKAVSNSHEGAVSPSTQTGRPPSLVPAETSRMSALPARRPRRGPARADPSCARCFAQDRARVHMYSARFRRTPYSASGFVVPSPTLSTMAATARSRRFGNRARSAAAWAAGISSRVRSVQ
jgi:hypothetical protein